MIHRIFELSIAGGDTEMGTCSLEALLEFIGEELTHRLGETSAVGITLISEETFAFPVPLRPQLSEEDVKEYEEQLKKLKEESKKRVRGQVHCPGSLSEVAAEIHLINKKVV